MIFKKLLIERCGSMKKKIITVFSVLIAVTVTVEAANFGTSRTIDVTDGVSVYMDGNELEMKNEEGKDVDAFIYDGTTYLPARAISEANGNSVKWDGGSGRVNITSNKPKSKKNPNLANVAAEEDKYYIFELSDNVNRTHVTYKNRYGIEIAADLYTSKDLDETQSYPALVIGPPYGGVKEQGPGVYANQLAQRGFVVIAFDPSYNGESGGEPRHTSSPEIFSEDFSAGVDYLGSLNYVNREQIGAIGICGSGGFALSAAAMDTRIKAVATAAMYDISAMGNSMDNESRNTMIGELSEKRWDDYISGAPTYTRTYPEDKPLDELPQHLTGLDVEW